MEQFSLEKWLKDKSRKVVTRRGNPVRIVCTDSPILHHPIVGFVECDLFTWTDDGKVIYGGKCEDKNDLFFADEEEELTEFEKQLQIIISEALHWTSDDGSISTYCYFGDKEIKKISAQILDLARKELKKKFVLLEKEDYQTAFDLGKAEILKDLPKWKKANDNLRLNAIVPHLLDDVLYWKGYYIWMKELEKLPKE